LSGPRLLSKAKDTAYSIILQVFNSIERIFRKIIYFNRLLILKRVFSDDLKSIIDIGSRDVSPEVHFLRLKGEKKYFVALDLNKRFIIEAKKKGYYNECVLADATRMPFTDKSFDAVLCFEVIEHIDKQVGKEMLHTFDQIARGLILVSTPVGFMRSPSKCPLDVHRSGWLPDEFRRRGYTVRGVIGAFFLHPQYILGVVGRSLIFPATWLSYLLIAVNYYIPESAHQMMCFKKFNMASFR
jgi:hypothetical protein